jgi:hypothetical protein
MSSEDNSLDIEVPISYEMPDEGLSDYTVTPTDAEETPSGSVVPEPPAYKPFPFALRPAPNEKIHIYFGVLVHQINRMVFNTDGLVSQTGVNNPQTIVPSNLSSAENRYKFYTLNWRGDVYLYWKTDSAGNVTECDIRGPAAPPQQSLPNEGGEGEFNVKIGNVAANDAGYEISALDQNVSTDVYWLTAFAVQEEDSNGSTSDSTSGSDKSTAIVPMDWHDKGYGALFTMESNEVLFEFVMRDVPVTGSKTVARIDDRFLAVCERDSMVVTGISGDKLGPVGAVIKDNEVILDALPVSFLRPNKVTLKLTGTRKGFEGFDMPERSKEQFTANERFINSAYPRD